MQIFFFPKINKAFIHSFIHSFIHADPGVVINEDVSFGFNTSDGSTVVVHSFVKES